jgi:type IX secretion system PorP/SprF family membrane protein
MKKIILASLLFVSAFSYAQTNEIVGQYYQNLPAYNPAHTGMNNFLDVNLGFRQQWVGFNGAPRTMYLSAYGMRNANSKKETNGVAVPEDIGNEQLNTDVFRKHGLGGYIMSNIQGSFKQREIAATYAYHIPLFRSISVSVGMSPSLYTEKIDMMDITVKDQMNDASYQSLITNGNSFSSLQVNIGATVYSDRFYVSYSMRQAGKVSLSGNEEIFSRNAVKRHHIMGGAVFHANHKLDIIPNTFIRLDATRPALFELGMRARYNNIVWTGLSYRNDHTIAGTFGMLFKNKYKFSYGYEHKNLGISKDFGISNSSGGTHELIVGIQMFKHSKETF